MSAEDPRPGPGLLPGLLMDENGPVFSAPWEAQAFAMTLKLCEAGHFTWPEWAQYLGAEIRKAQQAGDPDRGNTYYHHWLSALEKIVTEKRIFSHQALQRRTEAWRKAMEHTPHGEPVQLHKEILEESA
ncbi:MAG: nitrile hydratase accessory protein [Kiloniellales bacterium]|nr:nitrile hydratase accessory protein [Kiloniellales bacterium]